MSGVLAGKSAVVTGAASGIGRAIAACFADNGARVLAVDVAAEGLATLAAECASIIPLTASVAVPGDVARVYREARKILGSVDILANNAGISGPTTARLHEVTFEQWDEVMGVNLHGAFGMLQGALAIMLEQGGGVIVNTVSTAAFRALPFTGPYSISKAAAAMLTRQAAREYAGDNIRVNGICPGVTDTAILANVPEERMNMIIEAIPQQRVATSREMSNVALFLASDQSSFVNGALLTVDGAQST